MVNFNMLGASRDAIMATDGWRGTQAAIAQIRRDRGWPKTAWHHEVVNHSAGEIVNENGFTTNGIEARWSVLKRWVRHRFGGRLPRTNDRAAWRALLSEFQFRKIRHHDDTEYFRAEVDFFCEAVASNRRTLKNA